MAGVMASVIRRRETEEANAAYRRWCIRNAEVAALVMGETEPPMPAAEIVEEARTEQLGAEDGYAGDWHYSEGGNWRLRFLRAWRRDYECWWEPMPFTENMDHAMRAADAYFATQPVDDKHYPELFMAYRHDANGKYEASLDGEVETAQSLPEAVCKLLVSLVESSGRSDGRGERG